MGRNNRLSVATQVRENPFNDSWRLDAGDDAQLPAALPAGLDIDGEHPLYAVSSSGMDP